MAQVDFNGFKGRAKPLESIDFTRYSRKLAVGEDVLHAVVDVEAPRSGFDSRGRPRILYEPHKAWKHASADTRPRLQARGLAYPKWRPGKYGSESEQYDKLEEAMAIDYHAALRAFSIGRGQVLTENCKLAGYEDPESMILAHMDDEDNHLEAMVNFIDNANLEDELQKIDRKLQSGKRVTAADCSAFCRGYNGPGYAKNNYHNNLAKACNKWAKIPDTRFSDEDIEAANAADRGGAIRPPKPRPSEGMMRLGDVGQHVKEWQSDLIEAGYSGSGTLKGRMIADGDFGEITHEETVRFQTNRKTGDDGISSAPNLRRDGVVDRSTRKEMDRVLKNRREKPSRIGPKPTLRENVIRPELVTAELIFSIQVTLIECGYRINGMPDDKDGPRFRAAIAAYKEAAGVRPANTNITEQFMIALKRKVRMPIPRARAEAKVEDLRPHSRTIQEADNSQNGAAVGGIGGIFLAVIAFFQDRLSDISDVVSSLPAWIYFALFAAIFIYIAYKQGLIKGFRVDDHRTGAHNGTTIRPDERKDAAPAKGGWFGRLTGRNETTNIDNSASGEKPLLDPRRYDTPEDAQGESADTIYPTAVPAASSEVEVSEVRVERGNERSY